MSVTLSVCPHNIYQKEKGAKNYGKLMLQRGIKGKRKTWRGTPPQQMLLQKLLWQLLVRLRRKRRTRRVRRMVKLAQLQKMQKQKLQMPLQRIKPSGWNPAGFQPDNGTGSESYLKAFGAVHTVLLIFTADRSLPYTTAHVCIYNRSAVLL